MIKQRLNIPAVLEHTVNNKKYRVNGTILSINESNNTCTMRFNGNQIKRGIPMNKILVNEGFLDKIKEYGKKVTNYIVKKVKGFIGVVDEATGKLAEWSKQNIFNLAILAAQNKLPEGVYFAPSDSVKRKAGVGGMSIEEVCTIAEQNDIDTINKYWQKVIKRAGTTSDTITESVKYVNKHYYKLNPEYKALCKKPLNEVIYMLDNPLWGSERAESLYGKSVNAQELEIKLRENFRMQVSGKDGKHRENIKPYLIWGAPGIGKTAIVNQTIKYLKNAKHKAINLNLQYINLSHFTPESWGLPKDLTGYRQKDIWVDTFDDSPPSWLPVYKKAFNKEIDLKRDHFYNTGQYLAPPRRNENDPIITIQDEDGTEFEGGIIFFDEFSRRQNGVDKAIMPLLNEYKFGSAYTLASKWGFVFASNRAIDDSGADLEHENESPIFNMPDALKSRLTSITYVPRKEDWLKWAKQINPNTGESKVLPFIVEFIEATDEKIWYSTIVNGGYDDKLDRSEIDSAKHKHEEGKEDTGEFLMEPRFINSRMVTPRDWKKISDQFKQYLYLVLDYNNEGIEGEDYYKQLVKKSIIEKTDKNGNSYKEFYGGILPDVLMDALNEFDDDSWEDWINENGGLDMLDPTGSLNRGIKARYNLVMSKFIKVVSELSGDSIDPAVSQNPVIKSWEAFNSYAKSFTKENIESIWETGNVLSQYQRDDDKSTNFVDTINSKWKANSALIIDVLDKVFNGYPGNLQADIEEDLKNLKSAKDLTDVEVQEEAKKLMDIYSFKYDGKVQKLLFDKQSAQVPEAMKHRVKILLNSKVAQRFTHFACWIAKISLQVGQHKFSTDYLKRITDLFKGNNDMNKKQANLYDAATNASQVAIVQKQVYAARSGKNTGPVDKNLNTNYIIEVNKSFIWSANVILTNATKIDFTSKRK